jgi:uncharacterized protein (TIGR00288 family)
MISNYMGSRAPHGGSQNPFHHAPNAALLIDFDNVTLAIRSDLGKELKTLMNSDLIKGKVAVQRAYADWRRYPQYIVPLAESSVDLIFAPAYGSSKKNATDLRMAIDAMELVFTRPEIGTFILLTGDSDFSSCVLKLKEYGKYVIGVGMREASSDLLIQNCDEYYSYHSLSGLTREGEVTTSKEDPWVLVRKAAEQMAKRRDSMRTDRLKQVMIELDPGFDEKKLGYSKFSRFVQEAAGKGVVRLRRGENGQHEIALEPEADVGAAAALIEPVEERTERTERPERPERAERAERPDRSEREVRGRDGRRRRDERSHREPREPRPIAAETAGAPEAREQAAFAAAEAAAEPAHEPAREPTREPESVPVPVEAVREEVAGPPPAGELVEAYALLQSALRELGGARGAARDGDVKRKMLELDPGFDEGGLGFSKFSRFLRQAHDAEIVDLNRVNGGQYEVTLSPRAPRLTARPARTEPARPEPRSAVRTTAAGDTVAAPDVAAPDVAAAAPERAAAEAGTVERPTLGAVRRRRGAPEGGPPPILPGQTLTPVGAASTPAAGSPAAPVEESAVEAPPTDAGEPARRGRGRGRGRSRASQPEAAAVPQTMEPAEPVREPVREPAAAPSAGATTAPEETAAELAVAARGARGRGRGRKGMPAGEPPPLLPGQVVGGVAPEVAGASAAQPAELPAGTEAQPAGEKGTAGSRRGRGRGRAVVAAEPQAAAFSAEALDLPTQPAAIAAHLASYRGVGKKSAESLLERFEVDVYRALQERTDEVRELLGRRADPLLEQWAQDRDLRAAERRELAPAAAEPEAVQTQGPEARSLAEAVTEPAPEAPRKSRGRGGRGRGRGGKPAPAAEAAPPAAAPEASTEAAAAPKPRRSRAKATGNAAPEAAAEKGGPDTATPARRGGRGGRGRRKKEPAPGA